MYTLSLHYVGTTDTARSQHDSLADAHHALGLFARRSGLDVRGYGTAAGSLTVTTGTVNQAVYAWSIRSNNAV